MFRAALSILRSLAAALGRCSRTALVLQAVAAGVSGLVALKHPELGAGLAVWLAFVIAAGLWWVAWFRSRFPQAPRLLPVIFWLFFGTMFALGLLGTSSNPDFYLGAARLDFDLNPSAGAGSEPAAQEFDPRFLATESAIISGLSLVDQAAYRADLKGLLEKHVGAPVSRADLASWLGSLIEARPISRTSIEIRASALSPDQSLTAARALAEAYRDWRRANAASLGSTDWLRVSLADPQPAKKRETRTTSLVGVGTVAFSIACLACLGVVFGCWFCGPEARRLRMYSPLILMTGLLVLIGIALAALLSGGSAARTARVRLVAGGGLSALANWSPESSAVYNPHVLKAQCEGLNSPEFLAQIIKSLPPGSTGNLCLKATPVPNTSLIDIVAHAPGAPLAANAANLAAELYRESSLTAASGESWLPTGIQPEIVTRAEVRAGREFRRSSFGLVVGALVIPSLVIAAGAVLAWLTLMVARAGQLKRSAIPPIAVT